MHKCASVQTCAKEEWCPGAESNHRHRDFQSRALPTELPGRRETARCGPSKARGVIEAQVRTVQQRPGASSGGTFAAVMEAGLAHGRIPLQRPEPGDKSDSIGTVVPPAWSLGFLFLVDLGGGDRINALEPAVEIDIGATRRAERPEFLDRRLGADRAALALSLFRHGTQIGIGFQPSSPRHGPFLAVRR